MVWDLISIKPDSPFTKRNLSFAGLADCVLHLP